MKYSRFNPYGTKGTYDTRNVSKISWNIQSIAEIEDIQIVPFRDTEINLSLVGYFKSDNYPVTYEVLNSPYWLYIDGYHLKGTIPFGWISSVLDLQVIASNRLESASSNIFSIEFIDVDAYIVTHDGINVTHNGEFVVYFN